MSGRRSGGRASPAKGGTTDRPRGAGPRSGRRAAPGQLDPGAVSGEWPKPVHDSEAREGLAWNLPGTRVGTRGDWTGTGNRETRAGRDAGQNGHARIPYLAVASERRAADRVEHGQLEPQMLRVRIIHQADGSTGRAGQRGEGVVVPTGHESAVTGFLAASWGHLW